MSNALLFAVTGDAQAFLEWWTRHQPLAPVSAADQHMIDRSLLKLSAQCRALVKALSAHFAVIVPIEKLSETLTTAHGDNEELCRRLETDEPDSPPPSELLHAWAVIAGQRVVEIKGNNTDYRAMLRALGTDTKILDAMLLLQEED